MTFSSNQLSEDGYSTPIKGTTSGSNNNNDCTSTSDVKTLVSALPHLQNQEFFNAIESRYNQTGPFVLPPANNPIPFSAISLKLPQSTFFPKQVQQQKNNANTNLKNMIAYSCSEVLPLIQSRKVLLVDVRSFVKYSQSHIKSSINIAIPNTILRRKTFTLEKVSGVIVSEQDRLIWQAAILDSKSNILFYDEQSEIVKDDDSAIYYLYLKFDQIGYQGRLGFIQGNSSFCFECLFIHITG